MQPEILDQIECGRQFERQESRPRIRKPPLRALVRNFTFYRRLGADLAGQKNKLRLLAFHRFTILIIAAKAARDRLRERIAEEK